MWKLALLDAIDKAGGLAGDADWHDVTFNCSGETQNISLYKLMQKGDLKQNRLMQKGDIIHVPRNDWQKIFVLGYAKNRSLGMTLSEALSTVGGINELSANATGVFVNRGGERDLKNANFLQKGPEGSQVENEPTNDAEKTAVTLVIGTEFSLEPYDVVYVTSAQIERYNHIIRQLMPTISEINELTEGALRIHYW